jgi:methionine biosynthesis protein MetW
MGGGHPWPPPPDAAAKDGRRAEGGNGGRSDPLVCPACKKESTGIFQPGRLDHQRIVELIPPKSSVLDLGCGTGELLGLLAAKNHRVLGVELGQESVLACVRRGLDVIHADLEQGLGQFTTGQFDVVVLSQTLQAVRDVSGLVNDMLRVGKQCIVTFPNFGYHKLRNMLSEQGRAPESSVLRHPWYETPNIRFFTIADFEDFCGQKGIRVDRRIALDTESDQEVSEDPNLNADLAIFVISK